MGLIKYVFELIIIVYIVNLGLRYLGNLFGNTQQSDSDPISRTKNSANNEDNLSKKVDAEYIDYEEVK